MGLNFDYTTAVFVGFLNIRLMSEVRPHDRRSLTSTLMSIIDHQLRNVIAIVNHRSWIVNFSTIDRRSPIVTFTIDRRSSIVTVKNYYKNKAKSFCTKIVLIVKESDLWDFSTQSIWSLLIVVNQLFSQKWRSGLSKANFCAKTVDTIFANFVLDSTSFTINLIIIVWCQSIIFSEMEPGALKSELLFEDSEHNICCFRSSLNIFSHELNHFCLM